MKAERFTRTKSVMAASAIALVVAALTFGVASAVLPSARSPLAIPSGSAFSVSSAIYPSPACSGSPVLLYPGVTDCAVLTVHNNLSVPITVQNLASTIPSATTGCPASNFELPTFSGTLSVPANGTANTSGLPISLIDTKVNQDACQGVTIAFTFNGSAQYTDSTATVLAVSPSAPTTGQSTTLTAVVTGGNAANDPSTPTGTVTFNSCTTAACSSSVPLGTGSVGTGGAATLSTTGLTSGVHYLQAVYGGDGTDYTGSTSPAFTLPVVAPVTSGATNGGSGTSAGTSQVSTSPSSIAFTGADIAGMAAVALVMIGAGTFLVLAVRRRRRTARP